MSGDFIEDPDSGVYSIPYELPGPDPSLREQDTRLLAVLTDVGVMSEVFHDGLEVAPLEYDFLNWRLSVLDTRIQAIKDQGIPEDTRNSMTVDIDALQLTDELQALESCFEPLVHIIAIRDAALTEDASLVEALGNGSKKPMQFQIAASNTLNPTWKATLIRVADTVLAGEPLSEAEYPAEAIELRQAQKAALLYHELRGRAQTVLHKGLETYHNRPGLREAISLLADLEVARSLKDSKRVEDLQASVKDALQSVGLAPGSTIIHRVLERVRVTFEHDED